MFGIGFSTEVQLMIAIIIHWNIYYYKYHIISQKIALNNIDQTTFGGGWKIVWRTEQRRQHSALCSIYMWMEYKKIHFFILIIFLMSSRGGISIESVLTLHFFTCDLVTSTSKWVSKENHPYFSRNWKPSTHSKRKQSVSSIHGTRNIFAIPELELLHSGYSI